MSIKDVPQVASIHLDAFPDFFLSRMGKDFLVELYQSILDDPTGIALVYEQAGRLLGFVAGTTQPAGFYRRAIQNRWVQFGKASLPVVFREPLVICKLGRMLQVPKEYSTEKGDALLMSIAVTPAGQGQGIGKLLIEAYLNHLKQLGCRKVTLVTDRWDNEAVNNFYLRQGFKIAFSFTRPDGREMNEYEYLL